ncbi:methyltransferase domain-containing protein [Nocardia terpenica]|nr:methyltransferase domain-containing protein [Nocardia terpenica]
MDISLAGNNLPRHRALPPKGAPEAVFYEQTSAAAEIMTLANIPDGVFPFLQMETLTTFEAMSSGNHDVLVEMGCYDGRALEVARFSGARYVGVDLNESAIEKLRARIEREDMSELATTVIDDVFRHRDWDRSVLGNRPLYVLPFNLLGTFRDPMRFLTSLSRSGGSAVVSVFSDGLEATAVRQTYYNNCGVRALQFSSIGDGGVLFVGQNAFYSRSYSQRSFHTLLADSGATVLRNRSNSVGHCATILLDSLVDRPYRNRE